MRFFLSLFSILLLSHSLYAVEIAVIPYRITAPHASLNKHVGIEYARMMSLGIRLKKNVTVTSPLNIINDIKRLGLVEGDRITRDHLDHIGRNHYIDYIITGDIEKRGGLFRSNSLLYSVKDKRVVLRVGANSGNLTDLAEKEITELLVQHSNRQRTVTAKKLDVAFIIDSSYSTNAEWPAIKDAIEKYTSFMSDTQGYDSRIYTLPFSKKIGMANATLSENSVSLLRQQLNRIKPTGGNNTASLQGALKHALKNIVWRRGAQREIIIILNSPITGTSFIEKYAFLARRRKITIHPCLLGNVQRESVASVLQLSTISGGKSQFSAYHQKIYDHKGSSIHMYAQEKRFFFSRDLRIGWREGILKHNKFDPELAKPKHELKEIIIPGNKKGNTYQLNQAYESIKQGRIIRSESLQGNISTLLQNIARISLGKQKHQSHARVLLSDGKVSFWQTIYNKKDADYLKKKSRSRHFFYVACSIRENSQAQYGITFNPVIAGLSGDFVPKLLKTDCVTLIKGKNPLISKGLFHPPVWVLYLRVEKFKAILAAPDIRDEAP